ncbi:PadR family transcriptional regulator [Spiribacter halobius]|nr:PadR family transcriptional regulator [Spiribacter halobius]UEX77687.1 PadR family transcriptional regulator [Spiribacter halobius]
MAKADIPDFLSRSYWNGTIKMSLSKFFILCVLHRGPLHGYEIAREVSALTHGCCTPAEGTIYPVLRQYEQGGYVTVQNETVSGRQRRVYSLTDKGREAFRVAVAAWMDVTECLLECRNVLDGESMPDALRAG